jgi:hypothetical protein
MDSIGRGMIVNHNLKARRERDCLWKRRNGTENCRKELSNDK